MFSSTLSYSLNGLSRISEEKKRRAIYRLQGSGIRLLVIVTLQLRHGSDNVKGE